jgi:transcriptional regulator with XRE-family HTH domain
MESNIRKNLGLRIKELRKNKKLTQTQLAEMIGIDYKHLSRIEVGSSFPSINTLEKTAQALKVEIKEFFAFGHLKNKAVLIDEICETLRNADTKSVIRAYKVLFDIVQ